MLAGWRMLEVPGTVSSICYSSCVLCGVHQSPVNAEDSNSSIDSISVANTSKAANAPEQLA